MKILVNADSPEIRAALVDGKELVEYHLERPASRGIVGNVYRAKVNRVLPGMQAAFLDLGPTLSRSAYIHVSDLVAAENTENPKIEDLLKSGQWLIVQVAKGHIGDKGARVTEQVSLPGRLSVFLPFQDHVGVSRRIASDGLRRKMRQWIDDARPDGTGVIIRTAAEKANEDEIRDDLAYLVKLWNQIKSKNGRLRKPGLLYEDLDLVLRVIRDKLRDNIEAIVYDDADQYKRAMDFAREFLPRHKDKIHRHKKRSSLFAQYKIEKTIDNLTSREVPLKSGGALVIDQGEALTAIDVNTKSFVGKGKKTLESTVTANNLEACEEVARQLRLRNLGGIIVVDFVDMEDAENREQVWEAFHAALEKDPTKSNITRISELGLVEMTRKRTRESLGQVLMTKCPTCAGTGRVLNVETKAYAALRKMRQKAADKSGGDITLTVPKEVGEFIKANEAEYLNIVGKHFDCKVSLKLANVSEARIEVKGGKRKKSSKSSDTDSDTKSTRQGESTSDKDSDKSGKSGRSGKSAAKSKTQNNKTSDGKSDKDAAKSTSGKRRRSGGRKKKSSDARAE